MKKEIQDFVWPVENYTDKIHTGLKLMFQLRPWLSFTVGQMKDHIVKGYDWLANPNDRQNTLLNELIRKGIQKLVQRGMVKKVHSTTSVEGQWQWASSVADSGYTDITGADAVAKTPEAIKAAERRSLGCMKLWRLNNIKK
jgi:hypothetical protein